MRLYLLKENMINYICKCPKDLFIPTNDFKAFPYYKNHHFLYNKAFISNSQNIEYGYNNKYPNKYPVIVRPITNLNGMGYGTYYINNKNEIKNIDKDKFWCEILEGDHISVDIFYNNNEIKYTISFLGIKYKLFTFKYWEYLENYKLPKHIIIWINKYLKGYNGIVNIEIIDNKIIECHLRMGDLNYFQDKELINQVILCYQNKEIKIPKLNKIFLIPLFVKKGKYIKITKEDIFYCINKTNTQKIILNYFIDPQIKNPNGGDRICNFTVSDLNKGLIFKKELMNYIDLHYNSGKTTIFI